MVILIFFFLQEIAPYNKGAFKIEINFPAEYPFKPPKVSPVSDTMHYATCKLLNFWNEILRFSFEECMYQKPFQVASEVYALQFIH